MRQLKISCLLFVVFLTSIIVGVYSKDPDPKKAKKPKQETIVLTFKTQTEGESLNGEVVAEEITELQPNTVYSLSIPVDEISIWAQFIVVQVHAYLHNVTLGYDKKKAAHKYVTGQNIGLVQNVIKGSATFFVENDNPFSIWTLLAAVAYDKNAPIPGGCNMEFEVEIAPWLKVNSSVGRGSMVAVESQPSRSPRAIFGIGGSCDQPALNYQAYHLYLPEKDFATETYFDSLQKMMTPSRIMENSRRVPTTEGWEMRHLFSAYHGTGSVYAVVVSTNSQHASYVPAITYSCNPNRYTDTCQVLRCHVVSGLLVPYNDQYNYNTSLIFIYYSWGIVFPASAFSRALCALVLFIGLFVCFFGHSFFQTELFLMSTLMGSIFTYKLVAPLGMSDATSLGLASVGGVTVGNFWLLMWWICGSPLLSLLMATLTLGYLCTATVFYTVLADSAYMQNDTNYWLGFICCMLVVGTLCAPHTNRVNILACAVVGAYAAIMPIDHYIGANLKYIFINTMRRATVPDFNMAVVDPPFQYKDLSLALAWAMLAVAGCVLQFRRFGDRPAFPRSPHLDYNTWGTWAESKPLLHDAISDDVFA